MTVLSSIYKAILYFFTGALFKIPLGGGSTLDISLMILLLVPTGVYFMLRTKFMPIRMFPEMLRISLEKNEKKGDKKGSLSGVQALVVSTATRVGMGNLVGVVAAVSAGGAGAVFWMWIMAIIGSAMAFVEATLAQIYKEKDPLYDGYRGGPAYYMHAFFAKNKKKSIIAILFALSGLICWCAISQVSSNSVTTMFESAFSVEIPRIVTVSVLVVIAAFIVLRKHATVKVLDVIVPIMAVVYFALTVFVMVKNVTSLPTVFTRIFEEAFGIRQIVGGGIGAVIMCGVQRGLFSNEAGSGSAPCAAAAADVSHPAKAGLFQTLGVLIDTLVICTCTAMLLLTVPSAAVEGLGGMDLLAASMQYHFGKIGVVFIAVVLLLFSFSTFLGILFYARPNVAYVFGDNWTSQTVYKAIALAMFFVGGIMDPNFVWDFADIGIGLMTVFNILAILLMSKQAMSSLDEYTLIVKERKNQKKLDKQK